MAKLALTLSKEKFDELDDTLKEFYTTTKDGNYELDGVGSLNRALDAEKRSKQEAVDKAIAEALKPYEGVDLEAAKKAIADAQKAADEKLKEEGNFEAIKQQYEERIKTAEEKARKEYEVVATEKSTILAVDNGFSLKKIGGIGDAAEFDAIIEDVKTTSPFFFASDNATGSGASGSGSSSNGGVKTMPKAQWDAMGVKEQAAFIKSGGQPVD